MIPKPPGVEDIFPDRSARWNSILDAARNVFRIFNYKELIVPIMEFTEVFSRGIGDDTDIVSKEMFTFEDRGGRSLTLRPEGTAGVVRAYVENGEYNRLSLCKFFYSGPMFRAEKPQRGRLRQFNQLGAEIFGSEDPYYDYEIISIVDSIAKNIGIENYTVLLNSIGCRECRVVYTDKLKDYYKQRFDKLCDDCKKRLDTNPLRLLDCKKENCRALRDSAPVISEHICGGCSDHFSKVKGYLDKSGIKYQLDNYLVRGLDYYTRTTFEFTAENLGSQNAFAGGGRYDYLVEQFDGKPTPGVGFAAGIERMFLIIENNKSEEAGVDAYIIHTGGETLNKGIELALDLRKNGISADLDPETKGFKAQFKKAEREKASFFIIIGEDELSEGKAAVKNQKTGEQQKIDFDKLTAFLSDLTKK
jgi:histidyl-tRNA synthetase